MSLHPPPTRPMQEDTEQPRPKKIDVSWPQVVSSALAAVSSAVLLSTVGVAGTVIGAAVGSVVVTVGSAVYRYSLEASRQRVAAAQAAALERVTRARADANLAQRVGVPDTLARRRAERAEDQLHDAERDLHEARTENAAGPSWRDALAHLPWKWVAVVAGAVFVVAMLVILGFELVTGKAVSEYTGGTTGHHSSTLSGLAGGGASTSNDTPAPTQAPSGPGSTPTSQPTGGTTPSHGPATEPPSQPATPTPTPSSDPTTEAPPTATANATPTPAG